MNDKKLLFITGMLRSGTTLMEKLINTHHPSACILYQPCMPLFTYVKNKFLKTLKYPSENYPLGHLFCESRYSLKDFKDFLESDPVSNFLMIQEKLPDKLLNKKKLAEILPVLWNELADHPETELLGAKEVLCEEYAPYLADHGFKVIFVLRDPRDIITSMNYGNASRHVGAIRPTLYNLRNWRKSVAFASYLSNLGTAQYIRYEDLVQKPEKSIKSILSWLGVQIENTQLNLQSVLQDNQGKPWKGNSSFESKGLISKNSVGQYKTTLPSIAIKYVEAVCGPEMNILGYDPIDSTNDDFVKIITSFREPFAVNHTALPADYSHNPINFEKEIFRRQKIINESQYLSNSKTNSMIEQMLIYQINSI